MIRSISGHFVVKYDLPIDHAFYSIKTNKEIRISDRDPQGTFPGQILAENN